jgi:hypothetical protein
MSGKKEEEKKTNTKGLVRSKLCSDWDPTFTTWTFLLSFTSALKMAVVNSSNICFIFYINKKKIDSL